MPIHIHKPAGTITIKASAVEGLQVRNGRNVSAIQHKTTDMAKVGQVSSAKNSDAGNFSNVSNFNLKTAGRGAAVRNSQ